MAHAASFLTTHIQCYRSRKRKQGFSDQDSNVKQVFQESFNYCAFKQVLFLSQIYIHISFRTSTAIKQKKVRVAVFNTTPKVMRLSQGYLPFLPLLISAFPIFITLLFHCCPFIHPDFTWHSSPYTAFYHLLPWTSQKNTSNAKQSYSLCYLQNKFRYIQKHFTVKIHVLFV